MAVLSDRHQKVEIIDRKDYGPELWSIRVQAEEKMNFQPGQYATLAVERDGRLVQRAYSIVSSPLEDEMEFFFELVPQGELTPLIYQLAAGDHLWMRRQARGRFTLDRVSGHRKHLLLSTVTGVAPYVSMARTEARARTQSKDQAHELIVVQAASRSWEFAYCEELRRLESEANWLRYVPSVSRPWEDAAWTGEVGRVEDITRKHLDGLRLDPSDTTVYLCGHPQMIVNCKGILQRRGFSKDYIREEIYWIPAKPAPVEA